MAEFMRNTDAFALGMEDDARLRSTVVTIVMLDRSPGLGRARRPARAGRAADADVPAARRADAAARPAPLGLRPRLRPALPPAPGHRPATRATSTTVLEMARRAEMSEFDHARPMWTVTLVEGLADGGAALVVMMHHSLADGIGGMQIASAASSTSSRSPPTSVRCRPCPRRQRPARSTPSRHAVGYDAALAAPAGLAAATVGGATLVARRDAAPSAATPAVGGRPRPRSTARSGRSTRPRRRSCRTGG